MLEKETKNVESEQAVQDPITKAIGAIGKWQLWMCFLIFLTRFPVAWHQMSIIFLAPPMDFSCADDEVWINNQCFSNCSVYKYDNSIFEETIVSQWNLICEKAWLKNFTQTIFMLGILVGNMVFGHLADRLVGHFIIFKRTINIFKLLPLNERKRLT